jgi:hypothetical protein
MRFKYSTSSPTQNEFDSLPRIPLILRRGDRSIEAIGLVDSGATVNVLPYELGIQLVPNGTTAGLLFNYRAILVVSQRCL